jgi:outer membrane protein assembly factor BamB
MKGHAMYCRCLLLSVLLTMALPAAADSPRLVWKYEALSNLYAPPLVADMHPEPGKEIVISDSEARRLRCISAKGRQLWEFDGGWKKRLISPAALGTPLPDGPACLAIANGDGSLCCIDAATGELRWKQQIGIVEWGGCLWTDLEGGGAQEIVAGTLNDGVVALEGATGEIRWRYQDKQYGAPLVIPSFPAACDADKNGKTEIFLCGQWGPFCLNHDGSLKWDAPQPDAFPGAPVIADFDHNGAPELYALSRNADRAWCFNAENGSVEWSEALFAAPDGYSASSLAAGDVTGDGIDEIVCADGEGHVYIFSPRIAGSAFRGIVSRRVFQTDKAIHGGISLADVDGDKAVEILAVSGDHQLYCLDADRNLEWKCRTGRRIIYPATVDDADRDGKADILVCGSDRTVRMLTLDAPFSSARNPWPAQRFDAARTGSSFGKRIRLMEKVQTARPLFNEGGFERDRTAGAVTQAAEDSAVYEARKRLPLGWQRIPGRGAGSLSTEKKRTGKNALKLTGSTIIETELMPVPRNLRKIRASLYSTSKEISAWLSWLDADGEAWTVDDEQKHHPRSDGGLKRWHLYPGGMEDGWYRRDNEINVPEEARWFRLGIHYDKRDAPGYLDDVEITGIFEEEPEAEVLVNQAGYDTGMPKRFVVQSNFVAEQAAFALLEENGAEVWTGTLTRKGRIQGHFGNDWGHEYWRGDFSDSDAPGRYRIKVVMDGVESFSWPFEIGDDLLWRKTARPAYRFFWYQRCGMAIPGYHGACHLDDAAGPDGKEQFDCHGGWHDAGDYNTYHNAPYVYGLLRAYGMRETAFAAQDEDANGRSDFLDEILWGAEHSRRMIAPDGSARGHLSSGYGYWGPPELETDNLPGTGDERRVTRSSGDNPDYHQAAMARMALLMPEKEAWIEPAARSLEWALANGRRGICQLSTAIDLYCVTNKEEYAETAKALAGELEKAGISVAMADVFERFDAAFGTDHKALLREKLVAKAESMLRLTENPFGIYTHGPAENPNFFGTPADHGGWHVGTSSLLLEAATLMALAHRYTPDPRYLEFIWDQFNWELGCNPFNISLMEGCGSAFPPTYHHRYVFSGVDRGAVPGSVVNGITWRAPGDDRPYFDMSGLDIPDYEPNEVWLPHNTHYLNALSALMRARKEE